MGDSYYMERKDAYLKSLAPLFSSAAKVLAGQISEALIAECIKETRETFPRYLAELPPLGGDRNLFNASIIPGVAALAYIRALEKHNIPAEVIDRSIYEIYSVTYSSLPWIIRKILMWQEFSSKHIHQLRDFAAWTQEREFKENFVVRFVQGDGKTFDFGFDCQECAVLKYFRHMDAQDHMPYLCIGDFASSRALRTGLTRTQSLAFGGACCDFRYQRNTLGLEGLPLEALPEYQHASA